MSSSVGSRMIFGRKIHDGDVATRRAQTGRVDADGRPRRRPQKFSSAHGIKRDRRGGGETTVLPSNFMNGNSTGAEPRWRLRCSSRCI